jgi:hypothetical protein
VDDLVEPGVATIADRLTHLGGPADRAAQTGAQSW